MAEPQAGAAGRRNSTRKVPQKWQHPNSSLVKGSIIYNVKFWGYIEVRSAKGAAVVKQAIDTIKAEVEIAKRKGGKTLKATLAISYKAIRTFDDRTKAVLHTHHLGAVTYAGDDKTNKSVFAYIAQDQPTNKFYCFVYGADGVAPQLSLTVAQAFDVAFKEFNKTLGADKAKIRKKLDTVQQQVEDVAIGGGNDKAPPAAEQASPPPPAATPAAKPPSLDLTQAESVDEPSGGQGYFEPFDMSATEQLPSPVFGPGIDDIDDAIKSIEDQVGGLLEGFGAGFSLDS